MISPLGAPEYGGYVGGIPGSYDGDSSVTGTGGYVGGIPGSYAGDSSVTGASGYAGNQGAVPTAAGSDSAAATQPDGQPGAYAGGQGNAGTSYSGNAGWGQDSPSEHQGQTTSTAPAGTSTDGTGPSQDGTGGAGVGTGGGDQGGTGGDQGGAGGASEPLVLNLSGGAVHTTDLATSGVTFDVNGTGQPVDTGWITAGEAFLVNDPNGAPITSGAQMIANFGQLSAYDTNGDGQLSAAEADAAGLKLWVDQAGNGIYEPGELETLSQAGIASITIQATTTGTYDNGNLLSADSSFTRTDGTTGDIADAFLMNGDVLANGMIYDTAQGLTVRGADGSAVTIATGTGQSIDMAASGLSAVVDAGSDNTITAGGSAAVVIAGDGDTVDASAAQNALLIGAGDRVTMVGATARGVRATLACRVSAGPTQRLTSVPRRPATQTRSREQIVYWPNSVKRTANVGRIAA